jgi:hypothetical protein
MKALQVIMHALTQGTTPAPRVVHPQGQPTPGLARPAITDLTDQAALFRSLLLRTENDGADLAIALDEMIKTHPAMAEQVILLGSLGRVSQAQAIDKIEIYARTSVALASEITL